MKNFLLAGLVLLFAIAIRAQDKQPHDGSRVENLKIYYITSKLNLTPEEGQKFWPIYNKYSAELRQVYVQNKDGDEVEMESKILEVRKKYKSQFLTVLSESRVNDFFKAEKEFYNGIKKEMMQRKQQRKQNQTQNNK